MNDLHRRRSSGLSCLFVFFFAVCVNAAVAATVSPSSATEVPTTTIPSSSANASTTISPEIQGDLLMVHHSYAAAIDAYEQQNPRTAVTLNKIGVAYHHMFALGEARKYYQMALSLKPDYADALNNLAAVYHGQRAYRQAERTYRLALKYSPESAITYCNLGTAYFAEEKYKPGMEAYRKALALNPNIFDPGQTQIVQETTTRRQLVAVNYYLAKTYATAGKMQEALGYLRRAMEAGFKDRALIMKEKEFAALRSTPEFQQMMLEQTGGE
ncbi:MAG: tetratricopeptide repeat protein [Acidobacteriaceae bacterium]